MKLNKKDTTEMILETVKSEIKPCVKLQLDNIIFPKWSDLGLLGMIFSQKIKTKEQPTGCDYPEAEYQVVMRVINGKVLMTGGRPDAYTWTQSKVIESISDPTAVRLIGTNSASAVINLCDVMSTIKNESEQKMFADMFCSMNKDLLLVTTPAENRRCVEITKELHTKIYACVDSWMKADENGNAEATMLNAGDFLIVDNNGVYCIRHDEFMETHRMTPVGAP